MSSPGGSPRSPGSSPRSPGSSSSGSRPRPRGGSPLQSEDYRATLRRVRNKTSYHVFALSFTAFVGLFLVWFHWFGLVVAGALVGYISPSLRKAVVAGFGFGALVLAVFFLSLGSAAPRVIGMTPAVYLTVVSALLLPVFGSLVRGLEKEA
ncbi:MAG: hypothetical protein U5J64_01325 [Halobacteriales archaeon]|nr:hypothetical protein [Halobacteriales archaeon]